MRYDINDIRRTTADGIPDLADKIVAGIVNEEEAFNALFKGLRPKLMKELERRRDEETIWIAASQSKELKNLKDYIEVYEREAPEYKGHHIEAAKALISLIEKDEEDWFGAKSEDTVSAYRHYIETYENPAQSYIGKYLQPAKQKIQDLLSTLPPDPLIADQEAWDKAVNEATVKSYKEYLSEYDNPQKDYKGIHISEAKIALFQLQDDMDWKVAIRINSLDGYRQYLKLYKNHANEAELAIRHLIDEKAWKDANDADSIEAYEQYLSICKENEYPGYEWAHVKAAKTQVGNLRKAEDANQKEEERKRRIAEDNAVWEKARKNNTKHSYEEYLAKYRKVGGLHIREAENAILKLQSDVDWEKARTENTLAAHKRFVDKYEPMCNKYMSLHLPEAKRKVEELTPKPDPTPIKWKKWLFIVLALALCWFLWIQYHNGAWPYNIFQREADDSKEMQDSTVIVENVKNSLQEALDSIAYAKADSIKFNNQTESNLDNLHEDIHMEPENEVEFREPSPTPPLNPIKPTKDELFKEAKRNNDYRAIENLAKQGYKPSYIYLAKHYLKNPATHNLAYKYAQSAKKAGVKEADEILKTLELYDF